MNASELTALLVETTPCTRCGGGGSVPISPDSIAGDPLRMVCPKCNGTTHEPTETGRALLSFIKRYKECS